MKRTLLEALCGLAALVVLVSFQRQIARLQDRNTNVEQLQAKVDAALSAAGDRTSLDGLRKQLLALMEERVAALETRLQQAAVGSATATDLRNEVRRAETEVDRLRTQLQSDLAQQKQLVDAYVTEVRTREKDASLRLSETQNAISSLATHLYRDPGVLTESMLLPTVQLNGDDTVGSGTMVFSGKNEKTGKNESYVLTSFHVVRNILADTPKAQAEGFEVTVYLSSEKVTVRGKMVASQPKIDAALVQLLTDRVFPNVAEVTPRDGIDSIKVWDQVCAVGCPLGNDPVPSHGEISSKRNELNGANYWMINAPTYFGNSGGGVYDADTRQLIGVFSKIYTHGKGTPVVVPHMGLCTPIDAIYEWLDNEKLGHLLHSRPVQRLDLGNFAAPR